MRLIPQPESISMFYGYSLSDEINEKLISGEITDDEGYELYISPDKITATAGSEKGLYYAEVTFRQIKNLYAKIPCMKIKDRPRFSHRGFMIDCARHIFSVDELKSMISTAADFKFNKFHWHLSDDQGFRMELESMPELTEKGSVRKCDTFRNCHSDKEYGGYYTKKDIAEITDFCKERYIDIIPELDMPGHLSAFLHVYPEFTCSGEPVEIKTKQGIFSDILCIGNENAFDALCRVIDEMCEMFPYGKFHIGGDEVPKHNWKTCPKCRKIMAVQGLSDVNELQCYFTDKMADYLKNKGKTCIVWNDSLKGGNLSDRLTVQYWNGSKKKTVSAAEKGQNIILSPFMPYYADYPYSMHSLKSVYAFEPSSFGGLSEEGIKSIEGIESPVWTEFITDIQRLSYLCFPRWFAVAETAWAAPENKNYRSFCDVTKKLVKVYKNKGINSAPEADWNPSVFFRLKNTLSFFLPL